MLGLATCLIAATPRPLILTTDCGADMDDQWALAHLTVSPEFDVRAVVTTHTGNHPILAPPAAESSARIANEVLDHLTLRSRPPVIAGSSVPLGSRTPLQNPGVDRILSESHGFTANHRLTVIVIGAATDTASAILLDPTIAARIQIVAMAFKRWPEGGDDFNVVNDPIAWQILLDSGAPIVIGDSAVTQRDLLMTAKHAHAALDESGASGHYLAGLLDHWLATQRQIVVQVTGRTDSWPVWDEVTVAYLLGMSRSQVHPRPKLRPDLSFDTSAKDGATKNSVVTWVTAIDTERLLADLARKLATPR